MLALARTYVSEFFGTGESISILPSTTTPKFSRWQPTDRASRSCGKHEFVDYFDVDESGTRAGATWGWAKSRTISCLPASVAISGEVFDCAKSTKLLARFGRDLR